MTHAANESNGEGEPRVGDEGSLAEVQFPQLLLDLYRSRHSGPVELTRNKTTKRITFHQGSPIHSESNLANESLGVQLIDQGELSRKDHERVSSYMERKQCKEGVALLALELLEPKGLFLALKEQVRRRILETFAWSDGSYRLLEAEDIKKEVQPLRSDPLALIKEGLLNHWTPDRLLADLTDPIELFPIRTKAFDDAQQLLASDEELTALLDRIDGTRTLGETIGTGFNSPQVLATMWILTQGRLIRFQETAQNPDAEEPDEEFFATEIEIEVSTGGKAHDVSLENRSDRLAQPAAESSGITKAAKAMRSKVLELLEGLEQRSYYELLGISENAGDGEVRKAYFAAAKRFHPDALTHLGLTDIKQQAAQVFARIAEANDVLRDRDKRANYDARGSSEELMVDTRALAQAETAYRKGEILIRMGDFRGALEYLEPAVELWPDECEYQSALGWALHKQPKSDPERALVHLERAVELDDSDAAALFRLGTVLRASGEGERSARYLAQAKMIDPEIG
jgi:tetratricopeptide (TPR) repeat protein